MTDKEHDSGFTLIELLVALVIIATLLSIVIPRYFGSLNRSEEAVLMQNLAVMRDAIDKFHADQGTYPETLQDLVTRRYIRNVPVDPIAQSDATWIVVPVENSKMTGVYDVRSGAKGKGRNGKPYGEW